MSLEKSLSQHFSVATATAGTETTATATSLTTSVAFTSHLQKTEMLGKATRGRKRMELLHDMMEGRDYGQLKDLI